jgi:hypothetical protein
MFVFLTSSNLTISDLGNIFEVAPPPGARGGEVCTILESLQMPGTRRQKSVLGRNFVPGQDMPRRQFFSVGSKSVLKTALRTSDKVFKHVHKIVETWRAAVAQKINESLHKDHLLAL